MIDQTPRFPLYYCPPGVARPEHILHRGGIGVMAGIGPEDATPEERGGTVYGAAWDPRTLPLWRKSTAGWWVAMGTATPLHFARLAPIDGALVPAHEEGQSWLVPRLLRWRDGHGLVCAVPHEFRDYQWQAPAYLEPLMLRLRSVFLWTPDGEVPLVPDPEVVQIAVDVLALNYHVSLHELTLAGWLTDRLVLDVLHSAVDLTGG